MPVAVATARVLAAVVGRSCDNEDGVETAAGRARRLAVAARGAEAARGLATVLKRISLSLSVSPSLSPSLPPSLPP